MSPLVGSIGIGGTIGIWVFPILRKKVSKLNIYKLFILEQAYSPRLLYRYALKTDRNVSISWKWEEINHVFSFYSFRYRQIIISAMLIALIRYIRTLYNRKYFMLPVTCICIKRLYPFNTLPMVAGYKKVSVRRFLVVLYFKKYL